MTYRNTARYLLTVLMLLTLPASPTVGAIEQPVIQGTTGHQTAFFWRRRSEPDRLEGVWRITEGRTPRGQSYTGSLDVVALGNTNNLYRVSWQTSEGNYSGLGFYEDGRLMVGAGLDEGIYGVALYRIQNDGTLDGKWTLSTAEGAVGTEIATGGRRGELPGNYQIRSTDPGAEDSTFGGELNIAQFRDTYQVTWNVDDQTYRGIGLRVNDWLVVGWGTGNDLAVMEYEFKGNQATARWARTGSRELGMEKISLDN
jgi:hypothetical protein